MLTNFHGELHNDASSTWQKWKIQVQSEKLVTEAQGLTSCPGTILASYIAAVQYLLGGSRVYAVVILKVRRKATHQSIRKKVCPRVGV